MADEPYKASARVSTVAYFGRNAGARLLRTHCVTCCDDHPLTSDDGTGPPHRVYGDLFVPDGPEGSVPDDERCDICNVSILALSQMCQAEHEEQQARWARTIPVHTVEEMGCVSAIRCRVY